MNINGVEVTPVAGSLEMRGQDSPAIFPKKFWTEFVNGSDPLNPTPVDWVTWAKKGGGAFEMNEKISFISKHKPAIWTIIKPYYDHWKTGQTAPIHGVPLAQLPGMPPEVVDRYRQLHLLSIEDVAQMTEGDVEKIGLGARDVRERAKLYLQTKPQQQASDDVAALKAQLAALQEQMNKPKNKGGRPRKNPIPEAA